MSDEPKTIRFHYLKTPQFRAIHVDGAMGSITPDGRIQAALYTERYPVPQQTVHELREDGTQGPEKVGLRVAKDGVIRDVEVVLILELEIAKAFRSWLDDKIATLEAPDDEGA